MNVCVCVCVFHTVIQALILWEGFCSRILLCDFDLLLRKNLGQLRELNSLSFTRLLTVNHVQTLLTRTTMQTKDCFEYLWTSSVPTKRGQNRMSVSELGEEVPVLKVGS